MRDINTQLDEMRQNIAKFVHAEVDRRLRELIPVDWKEAFEAAEARMILLTEENIQLRNELQRLKRHFEEGQTP